MLAVDSKVEDSSIAHPLLAVEWEAYGPPATALARWRRAVTFDALVTARSASLIGESTDLLRQLRLNRSGGSPYGQPYEPISQAWLIRDQGSPGVGQV